MYLCVCQLIEAGEGWVGGGGGGYVTVSMYGRKAYILCLLANLMYKN